MNGMRFFETLRREGFSFVSSIKRDRVLDLDTCKFVRNSLDVLLVGPPGTGKRQLAQAINRAN